MRKMTATSGAKGSRGRRLLRSDRGIVKQAGQHRRDGRALPKGCRNAAWRGLQPQRAAEPGVVCGFGARCVGVLLERLRLHLCTQRFLAARRDDRMWEASCDYATLSLERLAARLRPGMFEQPLFPTPNVTRRGILPKHRAARGGR